MRRPWWLFWGVAHETPLHDPDHYRPPATLDDRLRRLGDALRSVAHQLDEMTPSFAQAIAAHRRLGVPLAEIAEQQRKAWEAVGVRRWTPPVSPRGRSRP